MAKAQYPRGVPFKAPPGTVPEPSEAVQSTSVSPDESAPLIRMHEPQSLEAQLRETQERATRLWHWMLILTVGTMTVVFLTVALGFFFIYRALARNDAPVVGAKPFRSETKVEMRRVFEVPDAANSTPATAARPPAGVARPDLPEAVVVPIRERSLQAVGGLTAAHLYQSYLNLGLLADATENDVYSDTEARKLLATVMALMDTVDQQLSRVVEAATDEADQKNLTRVRQLTTLLRTQAKELRAYWDTPEKDMTARKDHEMRFHKAREEAWAGIKDLLAIQEDE